MKGMVNIMIQSYLETPTVLASNSSPIAFEVDCIRTRSATCQGWLQHSTGSPIYKILSGGRYKINFNTNVTSDVEGNVALGLYADGVLIPGTTVITEITTAGNYQNVSFEKVVPICCKSNTVLTVRSVPTVLIGTTPTSTETEIPTIQNANIIISRIA